MKAKMDDPFFVSKPEDDQKRMSTYLKKQQLNNSSSKCVEESSHGTSSTRSTTTSTLPEDNLFSSKTSEQSSRRNPGFHNSHSSSGSAIEFSSDFGNGLEFGSTSFGDDGFGGLAAGSKDTKPKSARNLGPNDPTFDAFGAGDTGFGTDPFGAADAFDAAFGKDLEEPLNFGDDGFGTSPFPDNNVESSPKESASQKREDWKKSARSKSGSAKPGSGRRLVRPSGGPPRRHHSTDNQELFDAADAGNPPPRPDEPPKTPRRTREARPTAEKDRQKNPPQRQRSSRLRERRATMDHSGHEDPEVVEAAKESRRRASVSYTRSDGSLDPANLAPPTARVPPQRHKSMQGAAHVPPHRRNRRASLTASNSEKNGTMKTWTQERSKNQEKIMNMYRDSGLASPRKDNKNDSMGDLDVNMDLLVVKDSGNDGSQDLQLGARGIGNFLMKAVSGNNFAATVGDGDEPSPDSKDRRQRKPKNKESTEEVKRSERRDDRSRTKASLLERVADGPVSSTSGHTTNTSGSKEGLSYSDRIMMAQQKGKRN